jgi:hypothetical protein
MLTNGHNPDHICVLHNWPKYKLRIAIKALSAHEDQRSSGNEYSLVVEGS